MLAFKYILKSLGLKLGSHAYRSKHCHDFNLKQVTTVDGKESNTYDQWKVPQLSIMVIYNSTWSILIKWITGYIIKWQSDLANTKESVLPVCDKLYHTNNGIQQKWEVIKILRNYALSNSFFSRSFVLLNGTHKYTVKVYKGKHK